MIDDSISARAVYYVVAELTRSAGNIRQWIGSALVQIIACQLFVDVMITFREI